ncbi:hypothetical protein V8G54_017804 [Vigna mungo]|uniref:Uncharacterized protein n=1 Tax=Vigna mungo TaxID=3915 RepID=A0AAQ3NMW3_VIGMU
MLDLENGWKGSILMHQDGSLHEWQAGSMLRKNFSLLCFLDSREQIGLVNVVLLLTTQPHRRYNYNAPISTQPILIFSLHCLLLHSELNYINVNLIYESQKYLLQLYITNGKVHDHVDTHVNNKIY